jgi:hypothetical protein
MFSCEYDPTEMGDPQSERPPASEARGSARSRLILKWEALETWRQLLISFPIFAALMLLINIGPFSQPPGRSIFYGLFEGAVLSGLLAVATATERGRRR